MRNILFVCTANVDRSRTAEEHFSPLYPHLSFKSAGTNHKLCKESSTNPLLREHLEWADKIIVMEEKHQKWIEENIGNLKNDSIQVLQLADDFTYMTPELIRTLEEKCTFLAEF